MVTDLKNSTDFLVPAASLSAEFASTAVERDTLGGTPIFTLYREQNQQRTQPLSL